jgi:TonB family protein
MKRIGMLTAFLMVVSVCAIAQENPPGGSRLPISEDQFSTRDQRLLNIARSADAAWLASDFDGAIRFCDQGISLAPKEPGFWANKTSALMQRARIRYYQGTHSSDDAVKKQMIEAARADLRAALITSEKTLDLVRSLPTPDDPQLLELFKFHQVLALKLRAQAMYLVTNLVDESYASLAVSAIEDYVAVESDPQEKLLAQLHAGEMLIRTRKFREAFGAYQQILIDKPDNADANLGAAVSLINLAFESNEKDSLEQGLQYLTKFVDKAPERHPIRGSAEEALHYLTAAQSPLTLPEPATVGSEKSSVPAKATAVGGVFNGKALNLPKPPYPAIAKFARVQGSIPVRVVIDEEGNVVQAQAESGHPLLQAAAVTAAREARFSPTLLSGRPVKVMGIIIFNFIAQ